MFSGCLSIGKYLPGFSVSIFYLINYILFLLGWYLLNTNYGLCATSEFKGLSRYVRRCGILSFWQYYKFQHPMAVWVCFLLTKSLIVLKMVVVILMLVIISSFLDIVDRVLVGSIIKCVFLLSMVPNFFNLLTLYAHLLVLRMKWCR